jgi:hypothetical protein
MQVEALTGLRLASRCPTEKSRREGKGSEDEQVIILGPTHRGQRSRGGEDGREAPIVDRAKRRVTATAFPTHHRDETRYDAG